MFALRRKPPYDKAIRRSAQQRWNRLTALLDQPTAQKQPLLTEVDRLRALLLLSQSALPRDVFQRENRAIRRIDRRLRGMQPDQPMTLPARLRILADVNESAMRCAYWPVRAEDLSPLLIGLRRGYADARRACLSPQIDAEQAAMKLAVLGHQLGLLRRGWPAGVQPYRKLALSLARRLNKAGQADDAFTRDAHRLFAEKPARFADRIGGYWPASQNKRADT